MSLVLRELVTRESAADFRILSCRQAPDPDGVVADVKGDVDGISGEKRGLPETAGVPRG